jgi:hypothetical protein
MAETMDARPRVLLMALNYHPAERVVDYLEFLASADVDVEFVVVDEAALRALREDERTAAVIADPRLRVLPLMPSEHAHPVRRLERLVLYKAPGALLARTRRGLAKVGAGKPVAVLEAGHRRVAGVAHGRLFMPFYRVFRPYLLARRSRSLEKRLDLAGVERIVAGDISAVALGWRLARRHRNAVATTALDRPPYAGRTTGGARPETAAAADPAAATVPDSAAPEPVPTDATPPSPS